MGNVYFLQAAKRGVITIPAELRQKYGIKEGEMMTLIDLGGSYIITPHVLETDRSADRLAEQWTAQGESLESMLQTLNDVRKEYASNR